ncbi:MAG: hypothetical protein OQK46_04135 [Gammaproteobacteria bacterium]|nr:hypothetical protein [Gammaproteobacteria bacterium]
MKQLLIIAALLILYSHNLIANNSTKPIQYSSVENALNALKNKSSANTSYQAGWTIISLVENGNHVIWFFSPKKHTAYPAVIKKSIVAKDNGIETKIVTLCEAPKPECDKLSEQFKKINSEYK